jgi:hypothetical protein
MSADRNNYGPAGCHVLVQSDRRAFATRDPLEIRLFSKCRNEVLRLPAFLRHYRKLGVNRFFLVDNASTDGTLEYLLKQPDVHVFRTTGRFREARGGTLWLNALLSDFGVGSWCVTVDIDELLYYPGDEAASLTTLTRYFDTKGYQALYCLLLDMYPEGPLGQIEYTPDQPLESVAPLFESTPYRRLPTKNCPGYKVVGGMRERVFYPEVRERRLSRRFHEGLYSKILPHLRIVRGLNWVQSKAPKQPPCLTKVPLVRWDIETRYLHVNHFVTPRVVAAETGVLLHFKFLQDFHGRAEQEAKRGEYFDGASEYQRYAKAIRRNPMLSLKHDQCSVRFEGTSQLVTLGLMEDSLEWKRTREQSIDRASQPHLSLTT